MKAFSLFLILYLSAWTISAQLPTPLTVHSSSATTFTDYEPSYNYDLVMPIKASVLSENPTDYVPEYRNRYFKSVFGPRHLHSEYSNIDYFDFHKGSDISADVEYGGVTYSESNPPDVHCMCDGVVHEVVNSPLAQAEQTGEGRFVIVKCDQDYGISSWGNVYIAYRHLDSIYTDSIIVDSTILKDDLIGSMGATGHTSTVHLHFSALRYPDPATDEKINVHPMRLFDPNGSTRHLVTELNVNDIEITQLAHHPSEALFRMVIPYNQAVIRAVKVTHPGIADRVYDFEAIGDLSQVERDSNSIIAGLEFFVYSFNRGHSAYRRVLDRYEDGQLSAVYPASLDRPDGSFYPVLSEGLLSQPAYVLDMKVTDLPAGYDINQLKIEVMDIYGNEVYAMGTDMMREGEMEWSKISKEENVAEQHFDGTMMMFGDTIDLGNENNNSANAQTVGFRFEELNIPPGSTINRASLQFHARRTNSSTSNLQVRAELSGHSPEFQASTPYYLTNLNKTYSFVDWAPDRWKSKEMDSTQRVDVKPLVEEVIGQSTWDEGNAMTFILTGSGTRRAAGYADTTGYRCAYLYVEYEAPVTAPPANSPPVISWLSPSNGSAFVGLDPVVLSTSVSDLDNNLEKVEFFLGRTKIGEAVNAPYNLSWTPTGYGTYKIMAIATDKAGATAQTSLLTIQFVDGKFEQMITNSENDVEEIENGTVWRTNGDLEMAYDSYTSSSEGLVGHQHVGLRYENLPIPNGALITNAYIQFTADETASAPANLEIYGEASDQASPFIYSAFNVSTRLQTANKVAWSPADWNAVGDAGLAQRTPDLKSIIQEIVDREGWVIGNNLVLIIKGTGTRTAESSDGDPANAPVLHVEFSNPQNLH